MGERTAWLKFPSQLMGEDCIWYLTLTVVNIWGHLIYLQRDIQNNLTVNFKLDFLSVFCFFMGSCKVHLEKVIYCNDNIMML